MQVKVSVEAGVLLCRNPSVSSASEGKKKKGGDSGQSHQCLWRAALETFPTIPVVHRGLVYFLFSVVVCMDMVVVYSL